MNVLLALQGMESHAHMCIGCLQECRNALTPFAETHESPHPLRRSSRKAKSMKNTWTIDSPTSDSADLAGAARKRKRRKRSHRSSTALKYVVTDMTRHLIVLFDAASREQGAPRGSPAELVHSTAHVRPLTRSELANPAHEMTYHLRLHSSSYLDNDSPASTSTHKLRVPS
jgi:hypothetical protein